jgi:hypothetical protein
MGLSLAVVILLWVWIEHIGPSFSGQTLAKKATERTISLTFKANYNKFKNPKSDPASERNLLSNTVNTIGS